MEDGAVFDVVLYEPEIPPNTGNVIRLCANAGAALHLIEPLGFALDDKRLRRAGLDYREYARVEAHKSLASYLETRSPRRLFACSTRCHRAYTDARYRLGDALLFGPETSGLPKEVLCALPRTHCISIPMRPNNRSLNLSNAVAVVLFEAWRQVGFSGAAPCAAGRI